MGYQSRYALRGIAMLEYLILNEESLPFQSKSLCDKHLPIFFEIIKDTFKERVSPVRVSDKFDYKWYDLFLSDNYFLRDWLKNQEKEYSRRIKTLISKTAFPQIPAEYVELQDRFDLSQFHLSSKATAEAPSLGAAFLLDVIAVSFLSNAIWDSSVIPLLWRTINFNEQISEKECAAKNAARLDHWKKHLEEINRQRKENCRKGIEFWKNRQKEFPNLIFCKNTEKTFQNLSISNANFNRLWENMKFLNEHIGNCNSDMDLKEKTKLNFSDESDRVKNNTKLRRHREFTLLDTHIKRFFGLHVKNFPGAFRLHFLPDYKLKKIYIGYFGKHLPL
jgi:hypothetical protein